jgi:hypothetical protein
LGRWGRAGGATGNRTDGRFFPLSPFLFLVNGRSFRSQSPTTLL